MLWNNMKYLKSFVSSSLVFFLLIGIAHGQELIYEKRGNYFKTCRELQDAANKGKWSKKTVFSGFAEQSIIKEGSPQHMNHPGGTIIALARSTWICKGGYITIVSPMGKRVCEGTLFGYLTTEMNEPELYWSPGYKMDTDSLRIADLGNYPAADEERFCRYVN
jgi:hypothetical protein